MKENEKKPGIFAMVLETEADGISGTLWVADVDNSTNVKSFEFIIQEAGSVLETLNSVYIWIDSVGYNFTESEIVVWNIQDLVNLLGVQNENSLWTRPFLDFVSYYAGHLGLTYTDAETQLMPPISSISSRGFIVRVCTLFRLMRSRSRSLQKLLAAGPDFIKVSEEMKDFMDKSGITEDIWKKNGLE